MLTFTVAERHLMPISNTHIADHSHEIYPINVNFTLFSLIFAKTLPYHLDLEAFLRYFCITFSKHNFTNRENKPKTDLTQAT